MSQLGEIEVGAASVKATPPSVDVLICPPATLIARAVQTAAGRIVTSEEDCSPDAAGPPMGRVRDQIGGNVPEVMTSSGAAIG